MFAMCDADKLCALMLVESVSWQVSESSDSGVHTVSCPVGTGVLIPGVKHAEHEANHSPPVCVKVKNMWSFIYTPLMLCGGFGICDGMFPLLPLPSLWPVQVIACVTEFALIPTLLSPQVSFCLYWEPQSSCQNMYVWVKGWDYPSVIIPGKYFKF